MKKILIVDDEPNLPLALGFGFRRMGHVVDSVESAELALPLLNNHYDMAIVDYGLPGENGLRLLEQVREKLPKAIRIFATGSDEDFNCDEYLIHLLCRKPNIDISAIIELLK